MSSSTRPLQPVVSRDSCIQVAELAAGVDTGKGDAVEDRSQQKSKDTTLAQDKFEDGEEKMSVSEKQEATGSDKPDFQMTDQTLRLPMAQVIIVMSAASSCVLRKTAWTKVFSYLC